MGAVQHLVGGDRGIVTRLAAAFVSSILAVTTFSSSALGAPTKDPGVLMERAYILWAGLCAYCDEPIRLGYGAESAHRPERLADASHLKERFAHVVSPPGFANS